MMVGGEDEDFVNPARRDSVISSKVATLLNRSRRTFPDLDLEIGYAWAGTFGETEDSLPFIGEIDGYPNAYFALCYGANGTNFALMASEIIRDMYLRRPNENAEIFRFGR
jgi:glycine/D-amino acid oxidase-like deaminating enzyme